MRRRHSQRQRGIALIALLAILAIGAAAFLVRQLNAESSAFAAIMKNRNAEVLLQAKQALIGYVAVQAAEAGERNPGRLPCPEHAWYIGRPEYPDKEGIAGPSVGVTNPGSGSQDCASIGRLPWITLGLEKLVDATGEPLWYVVGPSWRLTTSTSTLLINSNTPSGDITVDGQQTVALIIAPGAAMNVQASGLCTARNQARSAPSPNMDARDYIECSDFATSPQFVNTAASTSINDQVLRITVADIMPAIEAAVANRIGREIAPQLNIVYGDALWGTSATTPAFPFPASFGDPGTSGFMGQAGLYQGLLPFNYHSSGCPGGDPRCSSNVIAWTSATPTFSTSGGPGYIPAGYPPTCYWSGSTRICEGYYYSGAMNVLFTDRADSITTGLRTFTAANHNGTYQAWRWNGSSWTYLGQQPATTTRSLIGANGAVNFITSAPLPWLFDWGYYVLSRNRPADADFSDHALLDATDAVTGWFARNEWYRLLYYAIAQGHAPGGSLSCISGGSGSTGCLQVTNLTDPTKQRGVLALAGRPLSTLSQTRPPTTLPLWLDNYLDSTENRNGDSIFIQSSVGRSFNDRFISVNKNP